MGQAKIKQRAAFAPQFVEEWESDDCVNFAVALARLTGWLHPAPQFRHPSAGTESGYPCDPGPARTQAA